MVFPFYPYLVGGFKHEFYFPFHIWDNPPTIDELIFFKMVIAPPTSINYRDYTMWAPVYDS